jgi:hypothetical protein
MFTFIGLIVVAFIILYRRSTEIVTINPMRGAGQAAPVLRGPEDESGEEDAPSLDFGRLINTIQQASQAQTTESSNQSVEAIRRLIRSNQFIEAIQLYRRMYKTDLLTAKKAVDKLMLEQ